MQYTAEKLEEYFRNFPGIGPRQARRFVHHLLTQNEQTLKAMAELFVRLHKEVIQCPSCCKFSPVSHGLSVCTICGDQNRDETSLMIVAKDVDQENMERSGAYRGRYFILGSTISVLDKDPAKGPRIQKLIRSLNTNQSRKNTKEIVIAMAVTTEGDHTADALIDILKTSLNNKNIVYSTLGRGLSTGTELEYSDSDTLQNALKNRNDRK